MTKRSRSTAYGFEMQVIECANCGAPLTAPLAGDQSQCRYCEAVNLPRSLGATDAPAQAAALERKLLDEAGEFAFCSTPERTAWLRRELEDPDRVSPFDAVPPEYTHWQGGASISTWRRRLPVLKEHWVRATAALRAHPEHDVAAVRIFWLSDRLARIYLSEVDHAEASGKEDEAAEFHLRQRAVLETPLQLLASRPQQQILRCRLACAAARAGDLVSARRWLASCDPDPQLVDLDSELRIGVCFLEKAANNPRGILEVVGRAGDEIPLAMRRNRLFGDCFRIHAYEALGELSQAKALERKARRVHGAAFLRGCFKDLDLAPKVAAAGCRRAALVLLLPPLLLVIAIIVIVSVL